MGDHVPLRIVGGVLLGATTLVGGIAALGTVFGWVASGIGWISSDCFRDLLGTAATVTGYAGVVMCTTGPATAILLEAEYSWRERTAASAAALLGLAFWLSVPWAKTLVLAVGSLFLVLGASAVLVLLYGSFEDRRRLRRRAHKPCPDCAETVKSDAKVCRYCGYRFADPP